MSLLVSDAAKADVIRASDDYGTKPGRYGAAFENEVEVAIARLAGMPRLYPLVADGVPDREIREYYIERFQQRVIYLMTGDDVLVVAIVHASRREGSWHGNLPNETAH